MGRKKKDFQLIEKIERYKEDYELDDLNRSNDEASIFLLCKYELEMERLFEAMKKLTPDIAPKAYKDLMSSSRDASNAYNAFLMSLGIARRERKSESDETPLSYIEKLRNHAHTVVEQRLKKLKCPNCNLVLAKYHIYIDKKGDEGALAYEGKNIEPIKYSFCVECSKCGTMVEVDERDNI